MSATRGGTEPARVPHALLRVRLRRGRGLGEDFREETLETELCKQRISRSRDLYRPGQRFATASTSPGWSGGRVPVNASR